MNVLNEIQIPHFDKEGLYFIPLGGAGEIGMNLSLYGTRGRWLMVDLGLTFGNERTTPGADLILPDPTFIETRKQSLDALVITHAHEDHVGAVPYLWPDLGCPIYATPFTAAFLRHKLREEGLINDVELIEIKQGQRFRAGPFDMEFISTTHSTLEASHLMIRTEKGNIFHTADWKMDPDPMIGNPVDMVRLESLGKEGVLALVGDSTNIFNKEPSGSEGEVRRNLIEVLANRPGRIAVACFASNIARVESIALAAKANGRDVALVGRSLWRMVETARSVGYLKDCPTFLTDEEAAHLPKNKVLYLCTGSQGEPRAALRRIATGSHPYVQLGSGDLVVFSSRVIPGNERAVLDVQNQLATLGVRLLTSHDAMIHVSGHPGAQELRALYKALNPRMIMPVHGEPMHLNEHAIEAKAMGIDQVLRPLNGDVARLDSQPPTLEGQVPFGKLVLDGDRLVPFDSELIRDRRKMAVSGAVTVSVLLDERGRLQGEALISARGLLEPDEDREDLEALQDALADALGRLRGPDRDIDAAVEEAVRFVVRRFFRQLQGRKPLVDVHVLRA